MALPKMSKSERMAYREKAKALVEQAQARKRSYVEVLSYRNAPLSVEFQRANPSNAERRMVYTVRRYFFQTPKGCPEVRPIEVLERTIEHWAMQRATQYPYNDLGYGWSKGSAARHERLEPRGWAHIPHYATGSPPSVTVTCNGREISLVGHRIDAVQNTEVPCDERCIFARGRKCECSCGGKHHGLAESALMVTEVQKTDRQVANALREMGYL